MKQKIYRQMKAFAIFAPLFSLILSGDIIFSFCGVIYAVILAASENVKKLCDELLQDSEELFA